MPGVCRHGLSRSEACGEGGEQGMASGSGRAGCRQGTPAASRLPEAKPSSHAAARVCVSLAVCAGAGARLLGTSRNTESRPGCLGSRSRSWPWASCSGSAAAAHVLRADMPGRNPWAGTAPWRVPGSHRRHRRCRRARCRGEARLSRGGCELIICGLELAVALRETVNEAKEGEMLFLLNEQ